MSTTINSAFQEFKANIEITSIQKETTSARQKTVRDVISSEMDVLDSFLTGSYLRSTMIAPLKEADIDIFIVCHPQYYKLDNPTYLLDKVRQVLLKRYKAPRVSRNGQAVTMTFEDFVVDVVPAFNRKGGGYLIPNSIQKSWIATNPKLHVDVMRNENKYHNGNLVPLVKMIKTWNRGINNAFVSFYLELLAMQIFKNVTISSYFSGMRFFFDKGREAIKYKVRDPAGYGGEINGLRNCESVDSAVSRFETAYQRAINAEFYANNGDIKKALDEWVKIFGSRFPVFVYEGLL